MFLPSGPGPGRGEGGPKLPPSFSRSLHLQLRVRSDAYPASPLAAPVAGACALGPRGPCLANFTGLSGRKGDLVNGVLSSFPLFTVGIVNHVRLLPQRVYEPVVVSEFMLGHPRTN